MHDLMWNSNRLNFFLDILKKYKFTILESVRNTASTPSLGTTQNTSQKTSHGTTYRTTQTINHRTSHSTNRITKSTTASPSEMSKNPTGPEIPGVRPTRPSLTGRPIRVFGFHPSYVVAVCATLAIISIAVLVFIYFLRLRKHHK